MLTSKEAVQIARKYNLEAEVRQELASGLTPEQALEEWDINQIAEEKQMYTYIGSMLVLLASDCLSKVSSFR